MQLTRAKAPLPTIGNQRVGERERASTACISCSAASPGLIILRGSKGEREEEEKRDEDEDENLCEKDRAETWKKAPPAQSILICR